MSLEQFQTVEKIDFDDVQGLIYQLNQQLTAVGESTYSYGGELAVAKTVYGELPRQILSRLLEIFTSAYLGVEEEDLTNLVNSFDAGDTIEALNSLKKMENQLKWIAENRDKQVQTCKSACVAGCYSSCSKSCGNSCTGTCANTCKTDCAEACGQSCTANCAEGCSGSCGNGCNKGCAIGCTNGCKNDCLDSCLNGCSGKCSGSCSGSCFGQCSKTCSGSCQASCANSCQGNAKSNTIN